MTIDKLHGNYRSGLDTVTSVVSGYFEKMDRSADLNAYLSKFRESALQRAAQMDSELKRRSFDQLVKEHPLLGVPMAIKDNLHIRGEITTCGSQFLANYRAPFDATCIAKLASAGVIFLGKTNMDEFAMGGSGENSAFGPTRHPLDRDRVPGGSSSGSAVAVASDMAVAALGSDTGGSIRLPASFCGIVGLKPTYGRVSRYGLVAFGSSLDQVGPMAATVTDVKRVFEIIQGHDPRDSTSARVSESFGLKGSPHESGKLRVGVPHEFFVDGIDTDVRRSVQAALKGLESRGAQLIPISLPHSVHAVPVYYVIAMAEASSNLSRFDGVRFGVRSDVAAQSESLEDFYPDARSIFGKECKRRILLGGFVLSAGYHDAYYRKACQVRELIAEDFRKAFLSVDVIAGPARSVTGGDFVRDTRTILRREPPSPSRGNRIPRRSCRCRRWPRGLSRK